MIDTLKLTAAVTIVACSAALLVAFTHTKTGDKIAMQQNVVQERSLKAIVPAHTELLEYRMKPALEDDSVSFWMAIQGSDTSYVFKIKCRGYAGVISYLVHVDTAGTIAGVIVLDQHETPGRGGRIEEKRSDDFFWNRHRKQKTPAVTWFTEQFKGVSLRSKIVINRQCGEWHACTPEVRATLRKNNSITAIAGATVSTKAMVNSLSVKVRMYLKHLRGQV